MFLHYDGQHVVTTAGHAGSQAAACRDLAAALIGSQQVSDPDVRHGRTDLVEVCADAFELLALDVDLLAARMRAGARLYDAVEGSAVRVSPVVRAGP